MVKIKKMKHVYKIFLPSTTLVVLVMTAVSCGESGHNKVAEGLPEDVRPVAEAIINDSPSLFASVVSYPIERPYPLKNVKDSSEMVKYYPTLVDEGMKKAVVESPDSAWTEDGWRGWTLLDGSYFYIDSGKIYEVTYISHREHEMLDSLQNEEIATLEPSLQAGWLPVMCIKDTNSGQLFRIDSQEGTNPTIYRLAGYAPDADLSGAPAFILYGTLELEGSMGNRFFHFSDEEGTTADFSPDMVSVDEDPGMIIDEKGAAHKYKTKADYWLDHVKYKKKAVSKYRVNAEGKTGFSVRNGDEVHTSLSDKTLQKSLMIDSIEKTKTKDTEITSDSIE